MRPRSRLTKRRLQLPTIREGYEEMVKDLNQANSLHSAHLHGHTNPHTTLSSEDYLMSICHLAHPTFPTQDLSSDIINLRQQDFLHQRLRLPRPLSTAPQAVSDLDHEEEPRGKDTAEPETLSDVITLGHWGERRDSDREPAFGRHGTSDPLEYLYGHQNNPDNLESTICQSGSARRQGLAEGARGVRRRANSIPRSWGVLPLHRKSSCPELSDTVALDGSPPPPDHTSQLPPHRPSTQERLQAMISSPPHRDTEGGGKREGGNCPVKHSLVSQWISDCRSAWKEVRIRACMLPAIAEM